MRESLPVVIDMVHRDVCIAQPIIVIARVFIIEPALEEEAGFGHIRNYPFRVPLWIGVAMYGRGSNCQIWILLMPLGRIGAEDGVDEGV